MYSRKIHLPQKTVPRVCTNRIMVWWQNKIRNSQDALNMCLVLNNHTISKRLIRCLSLFLVINRPWFELHRKTSLTGPDD